MSTPPAVYGGVIESLVAARLGRVTSAEARHLADALYARFPGMAARAQVSVRPWTDADKIRLRQLWSDGVGLDVIAATLDRTPNATRMQASRMKLSRRR